MRGGVEVPRLFVPAPLSVPSHGENPNVTYIPVIRFHTVMITPVFCQRVRVDPVDQGSPTSFWR